MLGGLALKWRWQQAPPAAGKPADKPNMVMGINVQVCWEKFANYWDVEMRLVPMEGDRFTSRRDEAVKRCDENTIGVVADARLDVRRRYEPVAEICAGARRAAGARPGSTSPCTSTARRARSSRRSSIRSSSGTSACRGSRRSTRRGTSTGSSIRVSAGSSGAMPTRCPSDLVF